MGAIDFLWKQYAIALKAKNKSSTKRKMRGFAGDISTWYGVQIPAPVLLSELHI
jgi:hypothetical protein